MSASRTSSATSSQPQPVAEPVPSRLVELGGLLLLAATADAVRQMSWDELQIFGATFFAEQISSVVKGGDRLLRQRLGELGPNERAASDARRSPSPSLFDLGYARLLLRLWFSGSDSQTTQTVWLIADSS